MLALNNECWFNLASSIKKSYPIKVYYAIFWFMRTLGIYYENYYYFVT